MKKAAEITIAACFALALVAGRVSAGESAEFDSGVAHDAAGEFDEAVAAFKRQCIIGATAEACANVGVAYLRAGRFAEAHAALLAQHAEETEALLAAQAELASYAASLEGALASSAAAEAASALRAEAVAADGAVATWSTRQLSEAWRGADAADLEGVQRGRSVKDVAQQPTSQGGAVDAVAAAAASLNPSPPEERVSEHVGNAVGATAHGATRVTESGRSPSRRPGP